MSAAFVRCGTCRRLVRRRDAACPLCLRPFGEFGASLSAEERDILEILSRAPLSAAAVRATLTGGWDGAAGLPTRVDERLVGLEEQGFVFSHTDARAAAAGLRYWITAQGREAMAPEMPLRLSAQGSPLAKALRPVGHAQQPDQPLRASRAVLAEALGAVGGAIGLGRS